MQQIPNYDIAIIGSGLAGCSLALALRNSEYRIALIDHASIADNPPSLKSEVDGFDPRVFAINLASIEFLRQISVWDEVTQFRHQPFSAMYVVDGQGLGSVKFSSNEINQPFLGSIVEHRVLLYALQQKLKLNSNITLLDKVAVEEINGSLDDANAHVIKLSDGSELSSSLVVGADGAHSQVRKSGAFKTREWDYGHTAVVCTVALEKTHQETAWQRFMHSGPIAFLPLSSSAKQSFVSIVWSTETKEANDLMLLSDDAFQSRLVKVTENWFGHIQGVSKRFSFPLRQCHAVNYVKPGMALVADAAHMIHPLAGQGINLGFKDVSVLANELLDSSYKNHDPGAIQVLSRYQRRRKIDNLSMMAAMDTFKYIFGQPSLSFSLLRHVGMSGVMHMPLLKQQIMQHAVGIK